MGTKADKIIKYNVVPIVHTRENQSTFYRLPMMQCSMWRHSTFYCCSIQFITFVIYLCLVVWTTDSLQYNTGNLHLHQIHICVDSYPIRQDNTSIRYVIWSEITLAVSYFCYWFHARQFEGLFDAIFTFKFSSQIFHQFAKSLFPVYRHFVLRYGSGFLDSAYCADANRKFILRF